MVGAGIDIVSDGEFSKGRNWAFYVHDRLSGIERTGLGPDPDEVEEGNTDLPTAMFRAERYAPDHPGIVALRAKGASIPPPFESSPSGAT